MKSETKFLLWGFVLGIASSYIAQHLYNKVNGKRINLSNNEYYPQSSLGLIR